MPIAGLLTWHANKERDTKRRPEPFVPRDFCWWAEKAEPPKGTAEAGAAMLELIKREQFGGQFHGPWTDELEEAGAKAKAPERLAWAAEDAILLAPHRVDSQRWGGYLIAMAEASGQTREFFNQAGDSVLLVVPETVGEEGEVEADPLAVLPIAGSPAADD